MPHKALNGRWPSSWGWAWLRVLAVGIWVGLIAAPAWAAEGSQPVVAVWLDPTGTATPDVAFEQLQGAEAQPYTPRRIWPFAPGQAYWFLLGPIGLDEPLAISVPYPGVDQVELFWRPDPQAPWQLRRAGDQIPNSEWPLPYLHPVFFALAKPPAMMLRVDHGLPSALPVLVQTQREFAEEAQYALMAVGAYVGFVLLVVILALTHALVYRQRLFALYAAYVVVLALTQASLVGAAARFLWPHAPLLADRAPLVFPMLSLVMGTWLVREIVRPLPSPWLDRVLWASMGIGLVFALRFAWFGLTPGYVYANLYFLASVPLLPGVLLWHALRRSDSSWWFVAGISALLLAAGLVALSNIGWLPRRSWTPYWPQIGAWLEIPLFMFGLLQRNRRERELQLRQASLQKDDPTTGLLNERMTLERLSHAIERAQGGGEFRVALLVGLRDIEAIGRELGDSGRNSALVHAALAIMRVIRPGDTAGRVGDAEFLLILEHCRTPEQARSVATRVIAQGLAQRFSTIERGRGLRLWVVIAQSVGGWPDARMLLHEMRREAARVRGDETGAIAIINPP